MNITEARIDHLSNLARLSLPGGEKEEIAREALPCWRPMPTCCPAH